MSIAGVWVNQYGSKMDLRVMNGNLVLGDYQSSTGSTGTYKVIGLQQAADQTPSRGQAVALAIEWRSVAAGPPDNSWHWVSGLSGQISVEQGADTLILEHALVASIDFPGLAPAGVYIDKLVYTRAPEDSRFQSAEAPGDGVALVDPMSGMWRSDDGTVLEIQVYPYTNNEFGWIQGNMLANGRSTVIYGVTDINAAADRLQKQSVSITALPYPVGPVMALAGTLDLGSGVLTLLELCSRSTAPDATYVQTQVSAKKYLKTF